MKYLLAYLLALSILSFQLSEMLVYVSFKINQEYIAKNLCVEKDVEGSTCKGCCQLKKKLDDQKQTKEALPVPVNQFEKLDINFVDNSQNTKVVYEPGIVLLRYSPNGNYHFQPNLRIFHPPQKSVL